MHSPNPVTPRDGWLADLATLYSTPGRHYHTLNHVREVLDHWNTVCQAGGWVDAVSTWVAVLLHDAVYVVGAPDNEARSADLVADWCARWLDVPVDVQRIRALILATAHHGQTIENDPDLALFVDCDMAILGADPVRYAEYEEQVRAEWEPVVGTDGYANGRRRFLEGLVGRRIYQSAFWSERLEARAAANLQGQLSASAPSRAPDTSGIQ